MTGAPNRLPWPPLLFVLAVGVSLLAHWVWPVAIAPGVALWPVSLALVLFAAVIAIWAHWELHRAGTTIRPDRPATQLVTTGPFAFSRHPLYLTMVATAVALALLLNDATALGASALLFLALNHWVIPNEERHLAERFPKAFAAYRAQVRRWV